MTISPRDKLANALQWVEDAKRNLKLVEDNINTALETMNDSLKMMSGNYEKPLQECRRCGWRGRSPRPRAAINQGDAFGCPECSGSIVAVPVEPTE